MTTQYDTKKLDINKPVYTTTSWVPKGTVGRVIHVLKRDKGHTHVVVFEMKGIEQLYILREKDLFNVPESRWLNVYAYTDLSPKVLPKWRETREEADGPAGRAGRVAVIEDKQDGSPWILHQL